MIELMLYVPNLDTWIGRTIKKGSGIVGSFALLTGIEGGEKLSGNRKIRIDYEGGAHIKTWEDKVFHAAGRHVVRYPTVARAWVDESSLIEVGTFRCDDDWKNKVYEITNPEALEAWRS